MSVDQSAIRGSRRSNPATYTGLLEPIRKAFAKANGVKPALFSANSEGACPACNGNGVIYTDLAMMAGVATTCEVCEGKRFLASVLEYHLGGRDISEVLAMSVAEAEEFFGSGEAHTPAAHAILDRLADVGLGYLRLGQPLPTLSGGERQRLKLATHMGEKGEVYLLDEPTTGLHLADVEQLLGLLDRLVDGGKSVIVIAHHQAVMAHADWIIDLGPGAGHDGGRDRLRGHPGRPRRRPLDPDRRTPRNLRGSASMTGLSEVLRTAAVPGAVALVARGDEVEVEVAGSVDVDGTAPMARDSIFRIASITKPIVAAAVMMLVDDGRIALDDPVERWLPELASPMVVRTPGSPVDDVVPAVRPITVLDLLTFRAGYGFPSDFSLPAVAPLFSELKQGPPQPHAVAAPDEWMAALARIPLLHQPGEAWLYNTCSDILGVLIARVTGRPLPEFLAERLFEPLGMVDTGFAVPAGKRDRFASYYRPDPAAVLTWSTPPTGSGASRAGLPVRRRWAGLHRRRLVRLRPDAARRRDGGGRDCCHPTPSGR